MARGQRTKGAQFERDCANLFGGKRNVMSGGSPLGGGDLYFDSEHPLSAFSWECKVGAQVGAGISYRALQQAEVEIQAEGNRKRPAAIIRADGKKPLVVMYAEDFKNFYQALSELGQGRRVKTLARDAKRILEEIERAS